MKKYFKKAVAAIAAATMTLTIGLTSFASVFPDVTKETYPWAIDAIESMAENGIILGYDDGTFNPTKTVSKLESLVLISRILGFSDENNESLVTSGIDSYGAEIDKYNLNYGHDEIAFLLMKGVITIDELDEYFDQVVGVSVNIGAKKETICIKASYPAAAYIESKPLHCSQRIIEKTCDNIVFEYKLIPNYEFETILLGYLDECEILKPIQLRRKLHKRVEKISTNTK